MSRIARATVIAAAGLTLGGCANYESRSFGGGRDGQDPTQVAGPPPLSLPPILAERGLAVDAPSAEDGTAPATPANGAVAPPTPGEESLLEETGPAAPGDIRSRVEQDAQVARAGVSASNALLYGPVAPRRPDQPPIIQRESKSWLGGIL